MATERKKHKKSVYSQWTDRLTLCVGMTILEALCFTVPVLVSFFSLEQNTQHPQLRETEVCLGSCVRSFSQYLRSPRKKQDGRGTSQRTPDHIYGDQAQRVTGGDGPEIYPSSLPR